MSIWSNPVLLKGMGNKSGNVVSFPDGDSTPFKALSIDIVPKQSCTLIAYALGASLLS